MAEYREFALGKVHAFLGRVSDVVENRLGSAVGSQMAAVADPASNRLRALLGLQGLAPPQQGRDESHKFDKVARRRPPALNVDQWTREKRWNGGARTEKIKDKQQLAAVAARRTRTSS